MRFTLKGGLYPYKALLINNGSRQRQVYSTERPDHSCEHGVPARSVLQLNPLRMYCAHCLARDQLGTFLSEKARDDLHTPVSQARSQTLTIIHNMDVELIGQPALLSRSRQPSREFQSWPWPLARDDHGNMPLFERQKLLLQSKRILDIAGKERMLGAPGETFPVSRSTGGNNGRAIVDHLATCQERALVGVIQLPYAIYDQVQMVPGGGFVQGDAQFLQATMLRWQVNEPGPVDQVGLRIHEGNRCISHQLAQVKSGLETTAPATNKQKICVHRLLPLELLIRTPSGALLVSSQACCDASVTATYCSSPHRGLDVLVEMKEIARVVLALEGNQPFVVDPVGGSHPSLPLVAQEVDIDAEASNWL